MTETAIKKEINVGISLLKIIACMLVIIQHFYKNGAIVLQNFCASACPVFMIISFLFVSKMFISRDREKFKHRLYRLAAPFYAWGIIYSCIFFIANKFLHFNPNLKSEIFWQMITGHGYGINAPLWYLFDLIIITTIFYIIFKTLTEKKAIFTLIILFFLMLFFQYSLLNYNMFGHLKWELSFPMGRLCEMIPFAVIGFLLGNDNTLKKLKLKLNINVITFLIILICISIPTIFIHIKYPSQNFGYSGIFNILLSMLFVILFFIVKINNNYLKNLIINISQYTLGIYCMHYGMGIILRTVFPKINEILLCSTIFILALVLSKTLVIVGGGRSKFIKDIVT